MKSSILKVYYLKNSLIKNFRTITTRPDFNVTYFEGGLGSQILAFIEFQNKKKIYPNNQRVDIEYFQRNEVYQHGNGLTHWKWRLDHYGIRLEDFRSFSVHGNFGASRRPNENEQANNIVRHGLFSVSEEILEMLPVLSTESKRNEIFFGGSETPEYGVVHLRKGDYLKVSSLVLGIEEIIPTLNLMKSILPPVLIFLSDGRLEEWERSAVKRVLEQRSNISIQFHDNSNPDVDEIVVHDLMRFAKFLITGNSTFSFSAGLLSNRPDSLVIFPIEFFGASSSATSLAFRSKAKFGILDRQVKSI
jgi:hypothetical protein